MDSKTLTTILIVIVCLMLFPVAIGIIGAVFGIIGGVAGGIFGLVTGIFGAMIGAVGAIFGLLFGWIDFDYWNCSFNFFDGDVIAAIILVLAIVLAARSRNNRGAAKR